MTLEFVLVLLWSARTLRSLLRQISFWQVKEYRLDRALAHVTLPTTRTALLNPWLITKWLILAFLLALPAAAEYSLVQIILLVVYGMESLHTISEIAFKTIRRPAPTMKALALLGACALALVGFVYLLPLPLVTRLLLADLVAGATVAIFVALLWPITSWRRTFIMQTAARKIASARNLTVIGITGSYGKSSTKEFLTTLLAPSFRTTQTPAHVNTEVGVAQVVLNVLRLSDQFFICEMGAYRRGEIARICQMVQPSMGILTAVHEQHLGLFGSTEALAAAKGELLQALPPDGIAIVNGDDQTCVRLLNHTPARKRIRVGIAATNDLYATDIRPARTSLSFTIVHNAERRSIQVPLLGRQHIPNLLAAWAAATSVGRPETSAVEAFRRIRPFPRTMEPVQRPDGALLVDDSYSANPDGVIAALEYLGDQKGTRVVILAPMIELGSAARDAHRRIGEALARSAPALAILTSTDYTEDIRAGARRIQPNCNELKVVTKVPAALELIQPLLVENATLLIEGRIPESLRASVLSLFSASP